MENTRILSCIISVMFHAGESQQEIRNHMEGRRGAPYSDGEWRYLLSLAGIKYNEIQTSEGN